MYNLFSNKKTFLIIKLKIYYNLTFTNGKTADNKGLKSSGAIG